MNRETKKGKTVTGEPEKGETVTKETPKKGGGGRQ